MIDAGPWIHRLATALAGLPDARAVHAVRVASRRLDVWLVLGGHRVLRDDLARLRSTLGPLRDLDVLMDLAAAPVAADAPAGGPRRPCHGDLPVLGARRREEASRVAATLGEEWPAALVDALDRLPRVEEQVAVGRVRRFLHRIEARGRRFEASAAQGVAGGHDDAALHDLRRAVRRARFALDWLGRPSPALEALHDAFGRVTDLVLVQRWLVEERPEGFEEASSRAEAALAERRREALEAWLESDAARRELRRAWRWA